MLTSGAEGGVVGGGNSSSGRRGLHAGLIKATRRSPAASGVGGIGGNSSSATVTPTVAAAMVVTRRDVTVEPPPDHLAPWALHRLPKQGLERGRERRRGLPGSGTNVNSGGGVWQSPPGMAQYRLEDSEPSHGPPVVKVKGIRAVSIMDTLSQLAGQEAALQQASRRLRAPASLPPPTSPASPTSHASARIRSRGRTPDWIKRIFEFAKRGQLEQLRASLRDMEATLVRNLSDHHGNNLVHVLAGQGHAAALAWLCSALQGAQLEGALNDENRSGLTPAACAVKYGHTACVEWLASNTRLRDRLSTRDGERCLLHTAAKYNQEAVVRWLVQAMRSRHLSLDQRDHAGDTPLHLAARAGGLEPCRLLVSNGADVSLKNDAGMKASDVAYGAGHVAVQHFLNLWEGSLGVAGELAKAQSGLEQLHSENVELRGYFRDVLSVGKRLAKERDEMCRDALGRLHKMAGLAAHDKMAAELAELAEENRALRERLGLVGAVTDPLRSIPSPGSRLSCSVTGGVVGGSGEVGWRGLLVGGLADMEHRLLLAEEGWRRLLQRGTPVTPPTSPPLGEPRRPLDILQRHVEQIEQQQRTSASCLHLGLDEARSLSSSESSLDTLLSLRSGAPDNIYSQLLDSTPPPPAPCARPPPPPVSKKREHREDMRRRLRELALTSESGNASVLEVIEPTTSEEDEDRPSPFLATSSPRLKALSMSLEDELEKIPEPQRRYSSVQDLLEGSCDEILPIQPPEPLNQPDLLMGTASMDETTGDEEVVSSDQTSTPTPQQSNKKRTFLQKFSLKASWSSSKRKVSSSKSAGGKRMNEISADDFKETYMTQRAHQQHGDATSSNSSASQQELSSEEAAGSSGGSGNHGTGSGSGAAASRTASSGSSSNSAASGSSETGSAGHKSSSCSSRNEQQPPQPSKSATPPVILENIEIEAQQEVTIKPEDQSVMDSTSVVDTSVESPIAQEEPPPPVRLIPNSPPSRHLVKTSLAEMKSGQLQHHIESMSVTTSEDSGIVARPSSSASKSDSLLSSRPDSSSSSSFKAGLFPMRLSTTELLNATTSSSSGGRVSPAPSEASTRHLLGKIEEVRELKPRVDKKSGGLTNKAIAAATAVVVTKGDAAKTETKSDVEPKPKPTAPSSAPSSKQSRSERAWYDLSDEEPDLLSSAAIIRVGRTSSDEEVCAT